MKATRPWMLMAPAAVCALLAVWIVLAAANVQTASVSLLIYGLANLIVYTDALDLLLRMQASRIHLALVLHAQPQVIGGHADSREAHPAAQHHQQVLERQHCRSPLS